MTDWHCPLCGQSEAEQLFALEPVAALPGRRLRLVRCENCALTSLAPRLGASELAALYHAGYEPFSPPLSEEPNVLLRWARGRFLAVRVRQILQLIAPGDRVLDLGCATGALQHALALRTAGAVFGNDMSMPALRVARRQGLPVWCGEAGHVAAPDGAFGLVMLWEVIEHVPHPRQTFAEAWRVLRPGGALVLSTPNLASLQARLWGRRWNGWHLPYHLQLFSFSTLRQMLEDAGFTEVRRRPAPLERFYLEASLRATLAAYGMAGTAAWLVSKAVGIASWPLTRLIDHLPFASALVVEARKC